MNIIKCMAEHASEKVEKAGGSPLPVTEGSFREALTNVLTNDYSKLVKKYGDDVMGFFCLYMDWE